MQEGDTLTCRLFAGGKIEVTLEDRVYPDRSCGQVEAGWWVFDPTQEDDSYFLSESGILYTLDMKPLYHNPAYTLAWGIHPGMARRMKEMENAESY